MEVSVLGVAKVAWAWLVSMVGVVWITLASSVAAHEVFPTIGDMELIDGQLVFRLEGNFESLVAGINLDGLADTEATPEAAIYDAFRAMEPDAFRAEIEAFWPRMTGQMRILVDGDPVALRFTNVQVGPVGNVELSRSSVLNFTAAMPEGGQVMQIDWPAQYGVLVLRQQGVEDGWDGYLTGGLSEEVVLSPDADTGAWAAVRRFFSGGD